MTKATLNIPPSAPVVTARLSNGLRSALRRGTGAVSYIGVLVGAGSRDDAPGLEGTAHFVEHTIFKGTRRRTSLRIANRMEEIGGALNAYTTKEETMIYTEAPAGYEERAVELLADLVSNATFPENELEREKGVIIEEIHSYDDNPVDALFDDFEDRMYAASDLGHNILGTEESVLRITAKDASSFAARHYVPENMVLYAHTPLAEEKMMRLVEKYFGMIGGRSLSSGRSIPPLPGPFDEIVPRDSSQANTLLGMRTVSRHDPGRHTLYLLNNYLGGPGMNSRLNQQLRDRRGLVYTVDCSNSLMSDSGVEFIYFGAEPQKVDRCIRLIRKEFESLAEKRLPDTTFGKIRTQYLGQLICQSDSVSGSAMNMAKGILNYGEIIPLRDLVEQIRAITPEEFRRMAEDLVTRGFSRLTYQ